MQPGEMKPAACEAVRCALQDRRGLAAAEAAHAATCAACGDALLDAEIAAALDAKPRLPVPHEFAERVAMRVRSQTCARRAAPGGKRAWRHVGRDTAIGLLLAATAIVTLLDPDWLAITGPVQWALVLLLSGEVAGIALWLGMES